MEAVGDSQEGELEALAAALSSPTQQNEAGATRGTCQAPSVAAEQLQDFGDIGGLQKADPPPPTPAPTLQRPAAQAFSTLCRLLGAEPHPQIIRVLNDLPAEAFASVTPYQRPGRGALCLLQVPEWLGRPFNENVGQVIAHRPMQAAQCSNFHPTHCQPMSRRCCAWLPGTATWKGRLPGR